MTKRFGYFVVFAEMRTGSNFLEANINRFDGLTCYGEAFNGAFIGYPNRDDILGVTQTDRESDPEQLIEVIKTQTKGLGGFRFFSDHDPRVQDAILDDPRCAKIVLTRNPVDSFVSLQIARKTGQWKLTNVKHALQEKVHFDADAFAAYLSEIQAFQTRIQRALQRSGQTAFYLAYDDLHDVNVLNGLATYLECEDQIDSLDKKLKRQNPEPIRDKVSNPDDMSAALAALDRFNLSQTPNLEPRRGPRVPHYVAAPVSPLLYIPIPGGPDKVIRAWLSELDNGAAVKTGFTRKSLRLWKSENSEHRSFAIVRHPLERAHAAFCDNILAPIDDGLRDVRQVLRKVHDLPLPTKYPDRSFSDANHKAAFMAFLDLLPKNLNGQTGFRVHASWASQTALLRGLAEISLPDMIIRDHRLQDDLAILCAQIGRDTMPALPDETDQHASLLARIVDTDMQDAARAAYARDYVNFGFGDWQPPDRS